MLFKSQVFTQASGSVGGLTYSRNRGGMYTRARTIPTNPNTAAQQVARSNFSNAVSLWSALTPAQQLAWDAYGDAIPVTNKLGDAIFLSGRSRFIQSNAFRLAAGLSPVADAPIDFSPVSVTAITASYSAAAGDVSVTFSLADPWVGQATGGLAIFVSNAQSTDTFFYRGPYLFAGLIQSPVSSPEDVTPVDPFAVGQKGFVRARAVMNDGRISTSVRTSFVAAA